MEIRELGEFGLINRLHAKLPQISTQSLVGIGDDASVFRPSPGHDLVISTDMLVEEVHFAAWTMSFRDIGWKSMAASISDIAAMGAAPKQAVLSIAIPPSIQVEDLEELYQGIAEIAAVYSVDVVGGDTVKTHDKLVISVTLTGEVPQGKSILRAGAKPGDLVFLTGTVGGSAAGLHALTAKRQSGLIPTEASVLHAFHQHPKPQVAFGRWLSESGACHALNDISDGLASESNEIARASQVSLEIDAAQIPIAPEVSSYCKRNSFETLEFALYGGEDYQLLGCLDPTAWELAVAAAKQMGETVQRIGRVTTSLDEPQVTLVMPNGERQKLQAHGYNHFGS